MSCSSNQNGESSMFSPKDPGETVVLTFDFTAGLAAGELLNVAGAPTVVVEVVGGIDELPAAIIATPPAINTVPLPQPTGVPIATNKAVQCSVSGGVLGTVYNLTAFATTTSSPAQTLACRGELRIQKA